MRREWEEAHKVIEELVEGPPSRRANATFTASPDGVSVVFLQDGRGPNLQSTERIIFGRLEANSSATTAKR